MELKGLLEQPERLIAVALALLLLLLTIYLLSWRRRLRRNRPIKLPYKQSAESVRNNLAIDIDTSPLTMPEGLSTGEAYYLVLDTETLNPVQSNDEQVGSVVYSPPVALSWQLLDARGNRLGEESHILCLGSEAEPIHTDATEIHGITDEMLRHGEAPEQVYEALRAALGRTQVLVAHNLAFHRTVLCLHLRELGLDSWATELEGQQGFCTMEWGRSLGFKVWNGGEALYPRLDELFGHLYFQRMHLPLRYASKTLRDVRLCAACLRCKL
ncbi:MAG: 3'-5' exonuclease [Porphyromonas sp.]|nr:3'-5' exonuclease [Porphyromonas sp.]